MTHVYQVVSDTNIGGAGRYLLNYIRHFDRNVYRVTVLLPENSRLKSLLEAFPDVNIEEIPFMSDKSFDKRCVTYLTDLFRKKPVDLIHTHASLSARIAARKAGIKPIVSTRHCIEKVGSFPMSYAKSFLNNLLCDCYIAVSDAVKENLLACGIKKKKIYCVNNGVEAINEISAEGKNELRAFYGIGEEPVFSIFARLEPVKGHKYLIEAAKQFLSEGNKGKFLIVGNGSLEQELKQQAEGFPDIIFTGYVPDTAALLNITDINVISSESEAMSLAILEAMSLGKPTIATNVGGNGQLIKDGKDGLLVPYADAGKLKNAFQYMASDVDFRNRCSQNAKEKYQNAFTAEIMVQNLEKLYEEVTNGNE